MCAYVCVCVCLIYTYVKCSMHNVNFSKKYLNIYFKMIGELKGSAVFFSILGFLPIKR